VTETKDLNVRSSLYYEEFEVGQSVTSAGRTVTESDVVAFAALSGDWNAIHTDAEYAAAHVFGQRVAHGLLGLSIAEAGPLFKVRTDLSRYRFGEPVWFYVTVENAGPNVLAIENPHCSRTQTRIEIATRIEQEGKVVHEKTFSKDYTV